MNLLITTECNNNCNYCFVKGKVKRHMDLEQITHIVNMPGFENVENVSILGGEPTLHPKLAQIVSMIREHNSNASIQLFSHCGNSGNSLQNIDCDNLVLVANCFGERNNIYVHKNLEIARKNGWKIALSYTIADENIDTDAIVNFCKQEEIRILRWSFAMPAYGGDNAYISRQQYTHYLEIAEQLCMELLKNKIIAYNDCPYPIHMRGKTENYALKACYVKGIRRGICLPPYDIYPDYTVEGCMGVGNRVKIDLRDMKSISELQKTYDQKIMELRSSILNEIEDRGVEYDMGCFGFTC